MASPNPHPVPPDKGRFFIDNELVFVVEHDSDYDAAKLIGYLIDHSIIRDTLAGKNISYSVEGFSVDRAYTFAHQQASHEREAVHAESLRDVYRRWRSHFSVLFYSLEDTNNPQFKTVIDLVTEINTLVSKQNFDSGNQPLLRSAAPHWLNNGVGDHTGGSGPGGKPVFADATINLADYQIQIPAFPDLYSRSITSEVEVVILDTAPSSADFGAAVGHLTNQPLLSSLSTKLTIVSAGQLRIKLPDPAEITIKNHEYTQADHGLFTAGLIHSIAPHAKLRLLQVLNDQGVGSIEGIISALYQLAVQRSKIEQPTPLLINCSLMIVTPVVGHSTKDIQNVWPLFMNNNRFADAEFALLSLVLEWVCDALRDTQSRIVASAGNDGTDADSPKFAQQLGHAPDNDRPQARYPAAFPSVLGVGALKEDSFEPAEYSNKSDQPGGVGIATFGGQTQAGNVDTAPDSGLLGVYIGPFPQPAQPTARAPHVNTFGWAWWAGTSFAAPIITGVLACLAGSNGDVDSAEQELNARLIDPGDGFGRRLKAYQGSQTAAQE